MNKFWPKGLSVTDAQSPDEILEAACEEWENATEGVFTLVFQKSKSEAGIETITVHAKHIPSNRTSTLFSVTHRLNEPYPVCIQPREKVNLPNILKKSYYQYNPKYYQYGPDEFPSEFEGEHEHEHEYGDEEGWTITNEWVSDTPSEFREKLTEAFNLSVVKSAVLNLTSSKGAKSTSVDDDKAAQE